MSQQPKTGYTAWSHMSIRFSFRLLSGCVLALCGSGLAFAQTAVPTQPTPAAVPQTVQAVRTSEKSDIVITATRITTSIEIDGHLDDEAYQTVKPVSGFFQQEPREGTPSSEPTDVWILFDDKNLYVAARCWDSEPEREIATEMRRDTTNIFQNDSFTVVLDTFHDLRNGFYYHTNPLGAARYPAMV
jgi:hypothetical protein